MRIERIIAERFNLLAGTFPSSIDPRDARLCAILDKIGNPSQKKILEVGCGKGRISRILQGYAAQVYGIDISENLLAEAKDICPGHFFKAEAYSIPFKTNTFDFVIALEVIEHIPELSRALAELARVLKPSGMLIVVDRNRFSLNNRKFLVPNIIIKRYHELKNEWMYPRDFPFREIWFNPRAVHALFARLFQSAHYFYILNDGEKQKKWHWLFRAIPATRYFVLWSGTYKKIQ